MSRCFPFPPPGYEKKIRTEEESDSLVKEKQKKHKKEKKDKEKRDGKEKKDKEGSRDNKYKEGKERKEKRRDKKDKEKSRSSLEDNTVQNNGNEESKFVQDLARRISNEEEGARESQSVVKSSLPCGVTENSAMDKRSENAVSGDQKGTEIMVQPVEKKEHAKNTTLRSSQEKTEAINKSKHKHVEEGGSMLRQRDVDTRNMRKRKDHETNGFIYENGTRLNEIHRPVASPVSSVENGSKLGAFQTPLKPVTELQGTLCDPEHRVNGFTNAQEPKRPSSSVDVKENGEASVKKRSHSDLKYLDEILNVPQREELHEFDESEEEQEWLFGMSGVKLSKKPKKDSTTLDETLQVWNHSLRIESADTVALPYVVPF